MRSGPASRRWPRPTSRCSARRPGATSRPSRSTSSAEAVEAVFRSWQSPRAERYRTYAGISADLGTAVVVQAMVFGNLDDRSGTGRGVHA